MVFYEKRPFTRAQFQRFMFAQSKPHPEMIDLIAQLKVRYGLKIAVVSNEGAGIEFSPDPQVQAQRFVDFFFPPASSTSASPTRKSFGSHWTSPRRQPGR